MKKILYAVFLIVMAGELLVAKTNASVERAVKGSFPNIDTIDAKKILLSVDQLQKVQKIAKTKVTNKVYRYYLFKRGGSIVGYGVLIARKVRTKKATVLYAFAPNGTLKFAEIMAFGEPPEYIPNDTWMGQFRQKPKTALLKMGSDVPTISGATLSARSITDGARVARAIFQQAIKH